MNSTIKNDYHLEVKNKKRSQSSTLQTSRRNSIHIRGNRLDINKIKLNHT